VEVIFKIYIYDESLLFLLYYYNLSFLAHVIIIMKKMICAFNPKATNGSHEYALGVLLGYFFRNVSRISVYKGSKGLEWPVNGFLFSYP